MNILSGQLVQFQQKLMRVLKQYDQLHKENARLKKELAKKDIHLKAKEDLLKGLQEKVDALQFSKGAFSEDEKEQLNARINTYIKEIDRCMMLLNGMPKE